MRVVLIGCQGVLGDIIASTLAADPDVEVVANVATGGLEGAAAASGADLVLWNDADEGSVARWLGALYENCGPRVLATMGDGRLASLWELTPRRSELGSLSPQTLLEAIRKAGHHPGGGPA